MRIARCPSCGGPGHPLGSYGKSQWFRCRRCGRDFSKPKARHVTRRSKRPSRRSTRKANPKRRTPATRGMVKVYDKVDEMFMTGSVNKGASGARISSKTRFRHPFKSKPPVLGVLKSGNYHLSAGSLVLPAGSRPLVKLYGRPEQYSRELQKRLGLSSASATVNPPPAGVSFVVARPKGRKTTATQSILFSKRKWPLARAKAWLRKHGKKYGSVDVTKSYYRFRQAEPSKFQKGSFRIMKGGR